MKLAVLFSSGKDSTFTHHYYKMQAWDIKCLCTLIPKNTDSFMFQTPLKELVKKQAESLGIPVLFETTKGEEEKELQELKSLLKKAKKEYDIDGVAVGALASDYQHTRVNHICHELNLKTYAPLWHKDQTQYMREMIKAGFDIRMTRIAAYGLDKSWLGKKLNIQHVDKLEKMHQEFGFHPGGEGGEFETIVLDAPHFKNPLQIDFDITMESPERGELVIKAIQ